MRRHRDKCVGTNLPDYPTYQDLAHQSNQSAL